MKLRRFDPGGFQQPRRLARVPRLHDAGVRDEQRALKPELPCERSEPGEASVAEDHPRAELEIERNHLQ